MQFLIITKMKKKNKMIQLCINTQSVRSFDIIILTRFYIMSTVWNIERSLHIQQFFKRNFTMCTTM